MVFPVTVPSRATSRPTTTQACIRSRIWCRSPTPKTGYMQNCNISPEHLMKESPLVPAKYALQPYLYNADPGPAHQRGRMVLELLHADDSVTLEDAIDIAFSTHVWAARPMASATSAGLEASRLPRKSRATPARCTSGSKSWNGKSDPNSQGGSVPLRFQEGTRRSRRGRRSPQRPDRCPIAGRLRKGSRVPSRSAARI